MPAPLRCYAHEPFGRLVRFLVATPEEPGRPTITYVVTFEIGDPTPGPLERRWYSGKLHRDLPAGVDEVMAQVLIATAQETTPPGCVWQGGALVRCDRRAA